MPNYVCDLCGWQSDDRAATLSHLRAAHQVEDAGPVGSIEQDAGLCSLRSGDPVTALDLDAWQLAGYAAGWDMGTQPGPPARRRGDR